MAKEKKEQPKEKARLHPRNRHRERYDLNALKERCPELAEFVITNIYGNETIDFHNPEAVKWLNKALLFQYYDLSYWDVPPAYLCPPIPGRADYIHYMADLLLESNKGKIPNGAKIKCLDIGVGANCVYPIIGAKEYGWSFIGSDTDAVAVEAAKLIVDKNSNLKDQVDIRLQTDAEHFFKGIVKEEEYIDLTICNPPFHASQEDAEASSLRKNRNLTNSKSDTPLLNFGGQPNELVYEGGEKMFLGKMILESVQFATSVFWFTCLVSKQTNLKMAYSELEHAGATQVKTFPMGQGNKSSRVIAWTFLTPAQSKVWVESRWQN